MLGTRAIENILRYYKNITPRPRSYSKKYWYPTKIFLRKIAPPIHDRKTYSKASKS